MNLINKIILNQFFWMNRDDNSIVSVCVIMSTMTPPISELLTKLTYLSAGGEWGNNNYSGINQDTPAPRGYKLLLTPPCTILHFTHTTLSRLRLRQSAVTSPTRIRLCDYLMRTSFHRSRRWKHRIGDISVRSWDWRRTEIFISILTKKAFEC